MIFKMLALERLAESDVLAPGGRGTTASTQSCGAVSE